PPGKDFVESFIAHVKQRLPSILEDAKRPIFIVPPDIRRPFIQMLRNHDIFIRAIGYNDIASGYQVRTVEVLTFEKQQAA
ncbi:MAG: hypothetical protein JJU21_08415, partial [Salinarimonas sp.]|nr:hypothetical protein [Salinarimonas sp.]